METINKVVDAAARTIYGPAGDEGHHEETKPITQQGGTYIPTEHQIRDETTVPPPPAENRLPTQGPGRAVYLNKPIVTTTSETSKLTDESPSFSHLSMRSSSPPSLKNTAMSGHRRADSGTAEAEGIAERFSRADVESGDYQRGRLERVDDDGIQRTAGEIDAESVTTEGDTRPKFIGDETSEDGIRRSDGRDRVQFDDNQGSTGNLKPSGDPSSERPKQGSTGTIPYMDLGTQRALPPGARIGTVQGGTMKNRQQELEDAQTAQSGGLGGAPVVFSTGGYDPTGTSQVQREEYRTWSKPTARKSTKDSNLRQWQGVSEDDTVGKVAECHSEPDTVQKAHPTTQASATPTGNLGPQRSAEGPSSSNEPQSQGDITNAASTNAISPMGPGLSKGTHGPVESSVGANPAHAQQPTREQQGGDRPTEKPKGRAPQPGQARMGSQGPEEKKEVEPEAGHLWVKSTGTAADGGDFDAAKPGAGKEADRLMGQAGVHRTADPRLKKGEEEDTKKGMKGHHHGSTTASGNVAHPTHHMDSAADSGKRGTLHIPGILHHHDTKKDATTPEATSGHKGLGEKLEKIKEKVKLRME